MRSSLPLPRRHMMIPLPPDIGENGLTQAGLIPRRLRKPWSSSSGSALPAKTMFPIIRVTEAGSGRHRSYSQARRSLLYGLVRPRSHVIATLVS
jgi:hypothetical protein